MSTLKPVGQEIAESHFNKKTVRSLRGRGISLIGITAVPGKQGFLDSETAYCLNDNGTHCVRSFRDVLTLADW